MRRFVEEADRGQWTLLPECLDDFVDESNHVRVIDVFVDAPDLAEMSFKWAEPAATGRPSYYPSVVLKRRKYRFCSITSSARATSHFRFTPNNGLRQIGWTGPFRVKETSCSRLREH